MQFLVLSIAAVCLAAACSMPISSRFREEAKDITISMAAAHPEAYKGSIVIWGGKIIKSHNLKTGTEIYVLAMPLNYRERPRRGPATEGRFIAKTADYLDPVVYSAGKAITVAGALAGVETHPVGELEYVYPVVDMKELHLFSPEVVYVYPDWYYWDGYPYYGPSFYYYGGFHEGGGREEFEEHEGGGFEGHEGGEGMEHGGRGR